MANNNRFTQIDSFKKLEAEKMHLYYEKRILTQKLKIRKMGMSMYMNPEKLIPTLLSGLVNNLLSGVKAFLGNIISGKNCIWKWMIQG